MKHLAKKRFGQNFLTDQAIITSLINTIHPQADDLMVEIGPGLGAMTQPLLKQLHHLHVVEIDRDIIQWMQNTYPADKVTIHHADVLKFDFTSLGERIRVVGNLPYNISSPILFHLLDNVDHVIDMHFMLQKEVVERMVAAPSTSEYGRLSVMLQYRLQMEYLITVPPESFNPAPKVESAFVRCIPHDTLPYPAKDEALFAKVVQAAFGQRRKTLRNTLKGLLDDDGFAALDIHSQLRAENLSVAQFVAIANYLA
ncbi:MAG TPA: 16S rRNA (adenine(1518)-N(6)/adenine(1519)-N(6))-dimethyltransferase RsmA [Methylophilus sp.]